MRKPAAQQDHGIRSIFVSAMGVEEAPPSLLARLRAHCTPHVVGHAAAGGTLGASLALVGFVALAITSPARVAADPTAEVDAAPLAAPVHAAKADRLPVTGGKLAAIAAEPAPVARSAGDFATAPELSYAGSSNAGAAAAALEAIQPGSVAVASLSGATGFGSGLGVALPTPPTPPSALDDDEEDDASIIPLPRVRPDRPVEPMAMPRPRPTDHVATLVPDAGRSEPAPGVAIAPTAAPTPPPVAAGRPGQILGFFSSPSEPVRPPTKTIDTPFGVPYVLQTQSVETACIKPELVEILRHIEGKYHQKVVITSGFRDRGRQGSLHRQCAAVDIEIPGVPADALAAFARTLPNIGGVGTYCHSTMIHVDIGQPRDWKYGCGSFFAMRGAPGKWGKVPTTMLAQQSRAGAKPVTVSDADGEDGE